MSSELNRAHSFCFEIYWELNKEQFCVQCICEVPIYIDIINFENIVKI